VCVEQLLRAVSAEKDVKRKRDVIKKVIAYMTLGIDVSRLFSDMVLVSGCCCRTARWCIAAVPSALATLRAIRPRLSTLCLSCTLRERL
jgi:hypothetical protein